MGARVPEWLAAVSRNQRARLWGQERQVHRFLLPLRKNVRIIQKAQSAHMPLQDFSAHDAVWLFARDPAALDVKEQTTLTTICQASETARTTYQLVQECASHASSPRRREA
jgi:hypothetical protein